MIEAKGKFLRIHNNLPFAATVQIKIEEVEIPYVKIDCNGDGWIAQGYSEYVPKNGYDSWKKGAIIGAEYALRKTKTSLGIIIFEIVGMITDTSPASVGAATIYAVWNGINYTTTQDEIAHIEKIVFGAGYDNLPNFEAN